MSEDASVALRRLYEHVAKLPSTDVPSAQQVHDHFAARATIDDALPALADIVAAAEAEYAGHRPDCTCTMHPLLAALREQLEARP